MQQLTKIEVSLSHLYLLNIKIGNNQKNHFMIYIGFGQLRNTHFRSRSKSPMNFKNVTEKTSDNENRSSFKGRKRLFKTLSLFSTTQTPIEQIKLDLQKACTSSNSVRNNGSRNVDDRKRSFRTTKCQDLNKRPEINMDTVLHKG